MTRKDGEMGNLVTNTKTYHKATCPAKGKRTFPWAWANRQESFDPIAFGREALHFGNLRQPCLKCWPELRP